MMDERRSAEPEDAGTIFRTTPFFFRIISSGAVPVPPREDLPGTDPGYFAGLEALLCFTGVPGREREFEFEFEF